MGTVPGGRFLINDLTGLKIGVITRVDPVNMKAVMYIYHKKIQDDYDVDGEELSTFIFGGTINIDYPENALKNPANDKTKEELEAQNERFLSLQLQEIEKIIPKILDI
jgi:hypothetical protein